MDKSADRRRDIQTSRLIKTKTDGQIDRRMDGQGNGPADGQLDRHKDGQIDSKIHRQTDECIGGWAKRETDRQTTECTDTCTDGQTDGRIRLCILDIFLSVYFLFFVVKIRVFKCHDDDDDNGSNS